MIEDIEDFLLIFIGGIYTLGGQNIPSILIGVLITIFGFYVIYKHNKNK